MDKALPIDALADAPPPASPLVEATLSLVQDVVRQRYAASGLDWQDFRAAADNAAADTGLLTQADMTAVEARILATGHRFAWSAAISAEERPEAHVPRDGDTIAETGFAHPDAPQGDPDERGRALRGVGDNVVQHGGDVTGIARYIRTNGRVLQLLTDGVPADTIAVIDDSGGTLTAPILSQFAGVICAGGTVRSHLGILTREYNIPCVMNAKIAGIADGDRVTIESSAPARTTEDYQAGIERVARVWRLAETA